MFESIDHRQPGVVAMFFLVLFELLALVAFLAAGNLPFEAQVLCYVLIALLTSPVWGGALLLLGLRISDRSRQRARVKRRLAKQVEREKLLNAG
ncbi:hypothetical protein JFQ84_002109 [Aeromonas hydrophila]|uniref:hypothetical protein n=1 Tax=Aeromonas hydrophila TaxID=644 RepID=UPI001303100B|nr:hypothetical protein [Aeromonas hydrophila]EGX6953948.1 hypothetical protein [Aeromonas hydrophila]QGZ72972.1 hypothetical protein GQR50_10820 [Aeromonas hydrophila]QGZ72981.1 hypothetical protein GQR50_10865 [Aeromonas hydrophila]